MTNGCFGDVRERGDGGAGRRLNRENVDRVDKVQGTEMKNSRKIWRRLAAAVSLLAALIFTADVGWTSHARAAEQAAEKVIRVGIPGDPGSIDPHIDTHGVEHRIIAWSIFEGLLTTDAGPNMLPLLAAKWGLSDDRKIYTFNLRHGVKFHNGKEMTSEDVVASLHRWVKLGGGMAKIIRGVADTKTADAWLKAVDPYTVQVTLTKPTAVFLQALATIRQGAYIIPKEIVDKYGTKRITDYKDYIGTGPFKLSKWDKDQVIRIVRFDGYKPLSGSAHGYGGARKALVDAVEFLAIPDPEVRAAELEVGKIQVLLMGPISAMNRLEKNKNLVFVKSVPNWYEHVYFNLQNGIFAEPSDRALKLRSAVLAALNIKEMFEATYGDPNLYRLDPGFMWRETRWWTNACAEYYNQANPAKARALMKEAGYKGEKIRFRTTGARAEMLTFSEVMAKQLRDVGFNVELVVMDMGAYTKEWFAKDGWELSALHNTFRDDPSLLAMWANSEIFARPTREQRPDLYSLVERLASEDDYAKRKAILADTQCVYYRDALHIRLVDAFEVRFVSKSLKNFPSTPELFFWNVGVK
jgi:peptide/nickel transport system substrate-binding protein